MTPAMSLAEPRYRLRDDILALRPRATLPVRFEGLWVSGVLCGLGRSTVAVVGSRAPSEAGRARAHALGARLAEAGVCVISGLALGIDGAAHAGAVSRGAATIGVLGGGHRCFFPPRNRALAEAMLACGGAVVSPFPPDEPARPWQFLDRNGIVAALADAVVVVEAAARSGALNTASWAGDLGIPVFAFPGDVDRPKVAGCLALIRDGATLVRDADDVLADMGIAVPLAPGAEPSGETRVVRTPLEGRLIDALSAGEAEFETLFEEARAEIPEVLATLARMEIDGLIERRLGNRYALRTPRLR
jgi:DNA processing protein